MFRTRSIQIVVHSLCCSKRTKCRASSQRGRRRITRDRLRLRFHGQEAHRGDDADHMLQGQEDDITRCHSNPQEGQMRLRHSIHYRVRARFGLQTCGFQERQRALFVGDALGCFPSIAGSGGGHPYIAGRRSPSKRVGRTWSSRSKRPGSRYHEPGRGPLPAEDWT